MDGFFKLSIDSMDNDSGTKKNMNNRSNNNSNFMNSNTKDRVVRAPKPMVNNILSPSEPLEKETREVSQISPISQVTETKETSQTTRDVTQTSIFSMMRDPTEKREKKEKKERAPKILSSKSLMSIKFLVSNSLAGSMIGPGGTAIKELMDITRYEY